MTRELNWPETRVIGEEERQAIRERKQRQRSLRIARRKQEIEESKLEEVEEKSTKKHGTKLARFLTDSKHDLW